MLVTEGRDHWLLNPLIGWDTSGFHFSCHIKVTESEINGVVQSYGKVTWECTYHEMDGVRWSTRFCGGRLEWITSTKTEGDCRCKVYIFVSINGVMESYRRYIGCNNSFRQHVYSWSDRYNDNDYFCSDDDHTTFIITKPSIVLFSFLYIFKKWHWVHFYKIIATWKGLTEEWPKWCIGHINCRPKSLLYLYQRCPF